MTASLTSIPAETDLLCEGCGYRLNGLPAGACCPECGKPSAESSPSLRGNSIWEQSGPLFSIFARFIRTSLLVIFQPARFYRTLATRQTRQRSRQFAGVHWVIVSLLFGVAAYFHLRWYRQMGQFPLWVDKMDMPIPAILALTGLSYFFLLTTTRLAAWLTSWEAGYRGLRLPLPVVLRGLDFHAAHYVPVALLGAGTVVVHSELLNRGVITRDYDPLYLYILCGEVLVCAVYLFWTYWIAMRNMMYANA